MQGRRVPDHVFKTRVRDESVAGPNPYRWQDVHTAELFRGKRVVVFSLPGAFTPTCSNRQCPAFELAYDEMRELGVDEVYCVSVNDAFVMHNWANSLGLKNVKLIPDGSGHFTRRMGMLINKEHVGFGYRSWRYAMVVDDGVVEQVVRGAGDQRCRQRRGSLRRDRSRAHPRLSAKRRSDGGVTFGQRRYDRRCPKCVVIFVGQPVSAVTQIWRERAVMP